MADGGSFLARPLSVVSGKRGTDWRALGGTWALSRASFRKKFWSPVNNLIPKVRSFGTQPETNWTTCNRAIDSAQSTYGSFPASWKCILSPGFQDRSRRDPKYVPRARHFCVIEVMYFLSDFHSSRGRIWG